MLFTYTYKARVKNVVDGDTIDFEVDLGFRIKVGIRTRLIGVNAPEVRDQSGRKLRDMLRGLLPEGTEAVISTYKDPKDKYGRWIAEVMVVAKDQEGNVVIDGSVSRWLLDNNLVVPA